MGDNKTRTVSALMPARAGEACLVLLYGDAQIGRRFPLEGQVVIGRDAEGGASIRVDSEDVSRRHALLTYRAGAWRVRDLGSTNGTDVNGAPLGADERALESGDRVRMGGVIFKYLDGNDVEALFHEEIHRLTVRDGLTGAYNRRYFEEALVREVSRASRHARPLWLAMLDVDHFKTVNDRHGHPAGDRVLLAVAEAVSARLRNEQLLARYGGEEFAMILPELEPGDALALCERVRSEVAKVVVPSSVLGAAGPLDGVTVPFGETVRVTVSIGLARQAKDMRGADLVAAADAALYRAKAGGRNRVETASS